MDTFGLFFEIMFFIFGIYLFFFAMGWIGKTSGHSEENKEDFRTKNSSWLRVVAFILIIIMAANLYFHFLELSID